MNTFDIHLNELSNVASHEYENLKKHVEDVIVKTGVVNLYLDGKNKDFAICLATDAKKDLENAILLYDQARTEYLNYLNANKQEFSNYINYVQKYPEFSICVEQFYREFYKR